MRIRASIAAIIVALMGVACSSNSDSTSDVIKTGLATTNDSLAYIIGANIAAQLHKMDSAINYNVVCKAILEHSQSKSLMSDEEARTEYLRYLLYVEPERRRGYEEQFLADLVVNDREFTRTKSGLTYHIDVIGDEKLQPKAAKDWVELNFTISRVGGEQLYPTSDSSEEYGVMKSAVDELPLGVAEGLKMIGKGGKIRAWVPSKLGYGDYGNEEYGVEPTETIFFDIELVEVEKGTAVKRKKELEKF